VLKIIATIVAVLTGIFGIAWTAIQIMDYWGLTTKAKTPTISIKNDQQQPVIPPNTPKPQKTKTKHSTTHSKPTEDAPQSSLKTVLYNNIREFSGGCSYSITNDSSYATRFILKHVEKQVGQVEIARVFLPTKSNYTVNKLPEGTYIVNYCIGNEWDDAKKDFKTIKGCKDITKVLSSEIERKLQDGDIVKNKRCDDSTKIIDDVLR